MINLAFGLAVSTLGGMATAEPGVAAMVPRRTMVDEVSTQVLCTATLLSDRALLTAGHCVDDEARGTLELAFGPDPAEPEETRLIADFVLHPEYSATDSAFDLAVVWLDEPVSRPVISRYEGALSEDDVEGSLDVIGYGPGEQRAGMVTLSELDEHTLTYVPGPDMTCGGDSGGPVLATIDGEPKLVGITSAGDRSCESWGIAAQVDEGMAELLELEPEPSAWVVQPEAICEQTCTEDTQCPGDLLCTEAGRCAIRGLEAGDLMEPCTSHDDCASRQCVVMGSSAQCLEPCFVDEPADPPTNGGCTLGSTGHGTPSGSALALLLLALGLRRSVPRTSERTPAAPRRPTRSARATTVPRRRAPGSIATTSARVAPGPNA